MSKQKTANGAAFRRQGRIARIGRTAETVGARFRPGNRDDERLPIRRTAWENLSLRRSHPLPRKQKSDRVFQLHRRRLEVRHDADKLSPIRWSPRSQAPKNALTVGSSQPGNAGRHLINVKQTQKSRDNGSQIALVNSREASRFHLVAL